MVENMCSICKTDDDIEGDEKKSANTKQPKNCVASWAKNKNTAR